MALTRILAVTFGVAVALAVAGVVVRRPLTGTPPASKTAAADAQQRIDELRVEAAKVEAVERRKKELEAQVAELERLRSGSTARALTALDATARALHVEMRQIALNEGRLEVTFGAASLAAAQGFGRRLEEGGVATGVVVASSTRGTFVLTAALGTPAPRDPS